MFDVNLDILNKGQAHKFRLSQQAEPLRYGDAIQLWQDSQAFRARFISILAGVPFAAYRWETPPVTVHTLNRPFEFVILNSPGLAGPADPRPFAQYFSGPEAESGIVVFENLGKDATLVVPSPQGPESAYGHLAAFTRQAPRSQNHALWRVVGQTMQGRITDRPVWLSTAGGGVDWLHVRLDSRPKYYRFRPYQDH